MPSEIMIVAGLLVLLFAGFEAGFRLGKRARAPSESDGGQIGAIQGALLGLLALLLGFSFAGAATRFIDRQDLIVREANAIGTAYLRAELLDEPHRTDLRGSLAAYVDHRLALSPRLRGGLTPDIVAEVAADHARIWSAARDGVAARPELAVALLDPVNDVLDLHAERIAAARRHLPPLVMGLLVVCSALSMGVIGYGCGLAGRRRILLTGSLIVLVSGALWTTIDLDYGRIGTIQLSDAPLQELDLGR